MRQQICSAETLITEKTGCREARDADYIYYINIICEQSHTANALVRKTMGSPEARDAYYICEQSHTAKALV